MQKNVHLISLGCPKNQVDSEVILGLLLKEGFTYTPWIEDADVVVINTCAFIQDAVQESLETILEVVARKEDGRPRRIVVTGCLPQRYGQDLAREIPEVDHWLGTGDFQQLPDILKTGASHVVIGKPSYLYDHTTPRILINTPHSTYVKIAEGCSHRCTYCLIPSLRGTFRSRTLESVVQEVEQLAVTGVVEINLVAQDTTDYGVDLGYRHGLVTLLQRLISVEGVQWFRVLYTYPYPENFPADLLEIIAGSKTVCPYLDLPIQHVSDAVLQRMGRRTSGRMVRDLVAGIRNRYPDIHLRTTVMVGFPGETQDQFEELVEFIQEMEFTYLGVFVFSPEEGAPASRLSGAPPSGVAEDRAARIMELQQGIVLRKHQGMIGTVLPVLVEDTADNDGWYRGRATFQAPEIDGTVRMRLATSAVGRLASVRIVDAESYDLIGESAELSS
jgi:ribosomal protein S12 methylthiotransferase